MEDTLINRNSPYGFKNGKTAKNRVVVPPMASETATEFGDVTDGTRAHYSRLAESGAGLVMVEYTYVHPSGKSEPKQLGVWNDGQIDGLKRVAEAIKSSGSLAGIQLTHSGGKSTPLYTRGHLMAPSAVSIPTRDEVLEIPRAMSELEIGLWKKSFLAAADRAVSAGFDLIELHAAHGYGLNQWLSPITNHRLDAYGGSLSNRSRLLFEIFELIRRRHPGVLLSVRIPGQDLFEGGLELQDSILIAKGLQDRGIDLVHVSSGIGGWRRPRDRAGEGYLVPEAQIIQDQISTPVIGVGGIQTAEYIDQLVGNGSVGFAAVGRAILAGPKEWKDSVRLHSL